MNSKLDKRKIKSCSNSIWEGLQKDIRSQKRDSLERSLFQLQAANSIGKDLSDSPNLDQCMRTLVDRISGLISVEIVSIMLMDNNRRELVLRCACGLEEKIVKQTRVKMGQGVSGWIAKTGEPVLIKDIDKDPRFSKRNGRYYTNSLLSVPLKISSRVIGVINVNNKVSRDFFTENDQHILEALAQIAAPTLETTRILEVVQARDTARLNFISDLSHELQSPLASIKEAVNLIWGEIAGSVNDDQKKFLEIAKHNIDRLSRLIDEMLTLAKADTKAELMNRQLLDVAALTEELIVSFGPVAQRNNITLVNTLPGTRVEVWADPDKIAQVITNLVDNAIKYNRPSGRVEIGLEEKNGFIAIWVRDTGVGIPTEELSKIFDRFYRIEQSAKGKAAGSGIGLSIAKKILAIHGGKLLVESEPGIGTMFTIMLPKDLRKVSKG